MKKIFRAQRCAAVLYILMAVAVFIYALAFMTDYENLFGLRLPGNSQVALFHNGILQPFNQGILVWAIVGVIGIALAFMMETMTKVPDRFALVFMTAVLGVGIYGSVYALRNLPAIMSFYKTMDTSSLYLEGITDYSFKFRTFYVGMGLYAAQIAVCALYLGSLILSHVTFVKLRKRGEAK